MKPENKELLRCELSARFPYGVMLHHLDSEEHVDNVLYNIRDKDGVYVINEAYSLNDVRPYLRPMSSMTDKEKRELFETQEAEEGEYCAPTYHYTLESYVWLLKHHFDFRGLIEKGLAIAAPEDMYLSRNERIKKEIIEYISNCAYGCRPDVENEKYNEWLEWLDWREEKETIS